MNTSSPNEEPLDEIDVYLVKHAINFNYSFLFERDLLDSFNSSKYLLNSYKLNTNTSQSPIQLRVYSNKGSLLTAYESCFGEFKRLNILDSHPPRVIPHLPINYELNFASDLKFIQANEKVKNEINDSISEFDYLFVVYWNIWSNYFSRVILNEVSAYSKKFDAEVMVLLINTGINIEITEEE